MLHGLKMPDALAGGSVESDERIGEQIVAHGLSREIKRRRSGGRENQPALSSTAIPAQLFAEPLYFQASWAMS
jgi:hypothetical protein